jgi:two-component system, cell cycle sensor histidine kinase and response regulator CckA
MDGPSTIFHLQKFNPSVKIIATSGLAFNVMVAEAANLGVKTFLSKPYTKEELLETIYGVLSVARA